jgi:hypothetical protein
MIATLALTNCSPSKNEAKRSENEAKITAGLKASVEQKLGVNLSIRNIPARKTIERLSPSNINITFGLQDCPSAVSGHVESRFFGKVDVNANVNWTNWARKHAIVEFKSYPMIESNLHVSYSCIYFSGGDNFEDGNTFESTKHVELASTKFSQISANEYAQDVPPYGTVKAYYIKFQLEVLSHFQDLTMDPKILDGQARLFIAPDSGNVSIIDLSFSPSQVTLVSSR